MVISIGCSGAGLFRSTLNQVLCKADPAWPHPLHDLPQASAADCRIDAEGRSEVPMLRTLIGVTFSQTQGHTCALPFIL